MSLVNKRKSDFDQFLKINEGNSANKLVKKLVNVKPSKKKRGSASPNPILRKESFKRNKFRFVSKKMSTRELINDTESIEEESRISSYPSVRKREQNLSIQRLISVDDREALSPSVLNNEKYIQNLKGTKLLKGGLLGKILNLQMKKKIGVQFIESNNIVQNGPDAKQFMLSASPRMSDELDKESVSSNDSSPSNFKIDKTLSSNDNEDSESSYDDESYKNENRRIAPGVFINKLDSQHSEESKTADEFQRDDSPEHHLVISQI